MRPRGEIRQALGLAARELAAERAVQPVYATCGTPMAAGTYREIAARSFVGFRAAKETIKNMTRIGELQKVGDINVVGSRRPMALYAPPTLTARAGPTLDAVMHGWSSR